MTKQNFILISRISYISNSGNKFIKVFKPNSLTINILDLLNPSLNSYSNTLSLEVLHAFND
jgi:hypothetical protein